jgi:hypothetical protein
MISGRAGKSFARDRARSKPARVFRPACPPSPPGPATSRCADSAASAVSNGGDRMTDCLQGGGIDGRRPRCRRPPGVCVPYPPLFGAARMLGGAADTRSIGVDSQSLSKTARYFEAPRFGPSSREFRPCRFGTSNFPRRFGHNSPDRNGLGCDACTSFPLPKPSPPRCCVTCQPARACVRSKIRVGACGASSPRHCRCPGRP